MADPSSRRLLIWASGQSGAGKTTLGEGLRTRYGFVHYDADIYAYGGDPTTQTGIPTSAMLAAREPERAKLYDTMAANAFGALFRGEDVPLSAWTPYYDVLCADVRRAWDEDPERRSLIVTMSTYPRALRAHIVATQLPAGARLVVLIDVAGGAASRKVAQAKAAAAAAGVGLREFLVKFSDSWRDEADPEARLARSIASTQAGFEPAGDGEIGVDVAAGMSEEDVLRTVCERLGL